MKLLIMKYALAIILLVCVVLSMCLYEMKSDEGKFYQKIEFFDCSGDKFKHDDGDSLYCNGFAVRMLGIDTPEIIHVDQGISKDQKMGPEASDFTNNALRKAKTITLVHEIGLFGHYCRPLVYVLVDGVLLQEKIIQAGYAYENVERYGDQGMSPYAAAIMKAWTDLPKPLPFENPRDWRKVNQVHIETEGKCENPDLSSLKL